MHLPASHSSKAQWDEEREEAMYEATKDDIDSTPPWAVYNKTKRVRAEDSGAEYARERKRERAGGARRASQPGARALPAPPERVRPPPDLSSFVRKRPAPSSSSSASSVHARPAAAAASVVVVDEIVSADEGGAESASDEYEDEEAPDWVNPEIERVAERNRLRAMGAGSGSLLPYLSYDAPYGADMGPVAAAAAAAVDGFPRQVRSLARSLSHLCLKYY